MPLLRGADPPAQASPAPRPFSALALLALWPAFVMAGVLEMLVFVVVDPSTLHWFGGESLAWSRSAVYSVTFLIFWAVITTSGAITLLLATPSPQTEERF